MKKRILSLVLVFSIVLPMFPLNIWEVLAENNILYGDADGNGKVELLDVNLMERYIEKEEEAENSIYFTQADVNADGVVDDIDVQMVKDYLVGNLDSLTPTLCQISFITDGGGEIEPIVAGKGYPYQGEIPTPAKDNYIFVNWQMKNGEVYYPLTEVISADMVLTAVYEPVESKEQLNITSFSLDDQEPDVSFEITGEFTDASEVKANITVLPKDGSDPVAVEVRDNGDGTFTVYAPDGFQEGASYELTLGEGLNFAEKDEMFRTVYFIIKKDEINSLKYDPDMIFIQDTDEMKYTVGGQTVDVLESALLSTEESKDDITGSFTMTGQELAVDDIVCIYETTDPRDRDYTQSNYEGDAMAFIRITAVNGTTYTFESLDEEDSQEVLAMPDSFPFKVESLPTTDGTIDINSYDAYALTMMGQTEAPEFKVDDFLTFYTVDFTQLTDETPAAYGQITKVEGNTISYKIITKEDIENYMGLFVSQTVESSEILESLDEEAFLEQVEQQALNSGFAEEAANHMVQSALQTEEVQQKLLAAGVTREEISQLSAAVSPASARAIGVGGRVKFSVEQGYPQVHATLMNGEHFAQGVGVALDVSIVLSFDQKLAGKTNSLKIELTAGFEQEVALGFDIDIEDRWKWYFIIPVLEDVDVTASIDIQNYTYMSVGAKIYTVSEENIKKWKALSETVTGPNASETTRAAIREINKLGTKVKKLQSRGEEVKAVLEQIQGYKEQLPAVKVDGVEYSIEQLEEALGAEDVSAAFDEVFNAQNEAESKTGMEQLMDRYKEMLEQETDWVELINQPLINQTYWIAIAAVKVNLNFIVKANINIQLGADMEYQVGKRYSFWLHLLDKTSGSSEMDLIDERFAFQFYVMGTLGIKAGIKAEIAFGLLSTDIASIGANVEFGVYLKLYGYFIYYFEKLRPAGEDRWNETEEMMGALYVDFGLYVTVKFKTQVFLNLIKYEPTLYDKEFPLLTAGVQQNVYDFALQPDEDDVLYVRDEDMDSTNGISMSIPLSYRTMKRIDLVTGEKTESGYFPGNFLVTFDNSRFTLGDNGKICVDVPTGSRYLTANMRIVWKTDKLTFSKYDIAITVPVVWTSMSETELKEKFTANVAVGNEVDGYEIVWSHRYGKADVFDLPSQDEILELIDYESYMAADGSNLKYASVEGYQEESTGLSLTTDKTYFFDVTPRTYKLTVTGVENADGSVEKEHVYTAQYGKKFDLSDLQSTGTNSDQIPKYTRFLNLTNPNALDEEIDMNNLVVDMAFVEKYGMDPVLKANYVDTTLTATYVFLGLGNEVPSVVVKFRSGTVPTFEGLADYVSEYGGKNAMIVSVLPAEKVPLHNSVTYTVTCKVDETKKAYTLNFDTKGGNTIDSQTYLEGSVILPPHDPSRTGHTFAGWYADEGCTIPFDFGAGMPSKDTTIYAKWNVNTYTITFVTTTGSAPNAVDIQYGAAYGELPVLSDTSMSFKGWFTQQIGGEQITADMIFTGTEDQKLYARWEVKKSLTQSDFTGENGMPQSVTYNGQGQTFALKVLAEGVTPEQFTVQYKPESSGEWTTQKPVNAGSYLVRVIRETDNDYTATDIVLNNNSPALQINKAQPPKPPKPEIKVENWKVTVVNPIAANYPETRYEFWLEKDSATPGLNFCFQERYTTDTYIQLGRTIEADIPNSYRKNGLMIGVKVRIYERDNYLESAFSDITYAILDGSGNSTMIMSVAVQNTPVMSANPSDKKVNVLANADMRTLSASVCSAVSALPSVQAAPVSTNLTMSKSEKNPTMTLSPEEVVLNRGKEFEVTLGLDQTVDVWGILAAVDYDADVLELLGYTYGDIFTEAQFTTQNDLTAVPYKLLATLDQIGTVSADGNFVTLKFKVRETAPEKETTVSLKALEVVDESATVAVDAGKDISVAADNTAPTFQGIQNGGVYTGETAVTVTEEHLASVTVNGVSVTVENGKFVLRPAEGQQTIIATDKAGNQAVITVTVNPENSPHTGGENDFFLSLTLAMIAGGFWFILMRYSKRKQVQ